MRAKATLLVGLGLLLGSAWPVRAATVTYHISFTATPIQFDFGGGTTTPPIDPVTGSFTITLDPSHDYSTTTAGITLDSLNLKLGSKLAFRYEKDIDLLQIGGKEASVTGFDFGLTNDFYLDIDGLTGPAPYSQLLRYIQKSSGTSQFTSGSIGLSFGAPPPPATAPIPDALPLFLTAIGAVGLCRYGARRAARRLFLVTNASIEQNENEWKPDYRRLGGRVFLHALCVGHALARGSGELRVRPPG